MALKALLDKTLVESIANRFVAAHPSFDRSGFVAKATNGLEALELKGRASLIADAMAHHLPTDFAVAKPLFVASLGPIAADNADWGEGFEDDAGAFSSSLVYMGHSAFLEKAAATNTAASFDDLLSANIELTQRFTAEFSMRPLIERDTPRAMQELLKLTTHHNRHVRRMVSECTRPRLPWAPVLQHTKNNAEASVPLLDALKWDPSLYVRRSVANHVGDILKDNRDVGVRLCREWTKLAKDKNAAKREHARRETLPPTFAEEPSTAKGKKRRATDPVAAAQEELLWVVRHALRLPDKKGEAWATKMRNAANL